MTVAEKFDVCIIGAGPGGYVAAIRAAQLGLKVVIVEANHLGGICLNWGCIPTKALLRCSEINHLLHNLDNYGFLVKDVKFDFGKIIARSRSVASKLSSGISSLLKKNKVKVVNGFGKISGRNKVTVTFEGKEIEQIEASHIIIATGAKARTLSGIEINPDFIWTYREAMTPKELPKSLVIIGSGAIGVEFASFYHNMGSEVTLVEMAENILPIEDEEISKLARKNFEKQGIKILTSAALKTIQIDKTKNKVVAKVEIAGKMQEIETEKAIIAIGIVPNLEKIGLEATKAKLEKGHLVVNNYMETDEPNLWAIGDVVSGPWLAHKASHEGVIAAEKIAEKLGKYNAKDTHPIKKENIPGCTYSIPQIASVGLTEKRAKELNIKVKIGRFPYLANGKAIAMGENEGLIKVIFDEKTGELLGAHMIGAEVTEMIHGYVLGKQAELTELDFMRTIYPHPTLSEMMHEAVLDAFGKSIHF